MKVKFEISIVICTMNRPNELVDCLKSILDQTVKPYEIAIIDCSQNEDTKEIARVYQNTFTCPIIYVKTKPGLTTQRNIGIKKTSGDIVTFLDDDVILDRNYLSEIEKTFHFSKKILGAGGRIVNNENNSILQKAFKHFFMLTSDYGKNGKMKRSGFPNFQFNRNKRKISVTQVLSGCNCSYRRSIFEKHIFDEYFNGYGLMEDVEFSYRVSKSGVLIYNPKGKVIHKRVPSGKPNIEKFFEMIARNHLYVFEKVVKENNIDQLFYLWSRIGLTIHFVLSSIKNRSKFKIKKVLHQFYNLRQKT
jgi:GT2 family glycosyltransferase